LDLATKRRDSLSALEQIPDRSCIVPEAFSWLDSQGHRPRPN
jgi:hypothetical protein